MCKNTPLLPIKSQCGDLSEIKMLAVDGHTKDLVLQTTKSKCEQLCSKLCTSHLEDLFSYQRWVHSQNMGHALSHRILHVGARQAVCFLNASLKCYTALIFLCSHFYVPSLVIREDG